MILRFFRLFGPQRGPTPLRSLRRDVLLFCAISLLVMVGHLAWSAYLDYQHKISENHSLTLSQARMLDEHLTRSLVSVTQAQENVGEDIENAGGIDHVNPQWQHERLKEKIRLTPQIRTILVVDEQGMQRINGQVYPAPRLDLSDREYFLHHRDTPGRQTHTGAPLISRADHKWLIPLSMRLNHQADSFNGLLLAGVEPDYFLQFYDSLRLPAGTRIQIVNREGMNILSFPPDPSSREQNIRARDPARFDSQLQSPVLFYETANTDGTPELITQLNSQGGTGLIVRIATRKETALASFWHETRSKLVYTLMALTSICAMLFLLLRQIRRAEKTESRLYLTQRTVDESPDMIFWCDEAGHIQYANRQVASVTGLSARSLAQKKATDVLLIGDKGWHSLWKKLQNHSRHVRETRLQTNSDTPIPVEITLLPILQNGERLLCITARDIRTRQEAEREIRRHRDLLQAMVQERTAEIRAMLDASPLAIALSVDNRIRLVNPAFETLFGYSSDSIIGQPEHILHASSPIYQESFIQLQQQLSQGNVYQAETELKCQDGRSFWAMLFAKALDPGTPDLGVILIIEDVTAQRIAAQAIRQSERLKRTIIDTTADGFVLLDAADRIVDSNPAFCTLLGLQRDTIAGQTPEQIWGEAIGGKIFPPLQKQASALRFQEVELPTAEGLVRPFLASSSPILDDSGQMEYRFAFITDISQQKENEHSLLAAKEAAESASQTQSLFLANMSHELRTPMHAILSFSEMGLQKAGHTDISQIIRYFQRIHASGTRLLALLNDLLDMSRLDASKMPYNKARHILQNTVSHAVAEISSLLGDKQIQLQLNGATLKIMAIYDKTRLIQVVVNLLSNAIKFSPQGGRIDIDFLPSARLKNGDEAVGFQIRDLGPGVAAEDLESIFDKFQQSKNIISTGGTGLGLAICRQIMLDHGGSIHADNHPQGGARFTVLLPASSTPAEAGDNKTS